MSPRKRTLRLTPARQVSSARFDAPRASVYSFAVLGAGTPELISVPFGGRTKTSPGRLAGTVRIPHLQRSQSVPQDKICLSQGFPGHHVIQITLSHRIHQVQGGRK
jgi:hypothetical protein